MLEHMQCCGRTDVGREREENQDHFLIADLHKSIDVRQTSLSEELPRHLEDDLQSKLLVVADGLGGHAAGRRASSLAVQSLTRYVLNTLQWFFQLGRHPEEIFLDDLTESIRYCHRQLRDESDAIPDRRGMGTTLTIAYVIWPQLFVIHVGDSRLYLWRDQHLKRLTRDHTMAQRFVEEGLLSEADADTSRWSHMLWNVVGGEGGDLTAEVHTAELRDGDILLLSTDGLTNHVSDEEIATLLAQDNSIDSTCQKLIDAANNAGGRDNITVVMAKFNGRDKPSSPSASIPDDTLDLDARSPDDSLDQTRPL